MSPSPKKEKNHPNGKKGRPARKGQKLKTQTITQKLEIIEMRDNGASWIKIANDKGINESTVRGIYKKKDEIQAQGKPLFSLKF